MIAGAATFTWLAWEAAIWVVSRSQVAYRLVTKWEVKASKAETRWRSPSNVGEIRTGEPLSPGKWLT